MSEQQRLHSSRPRRKRSLMARALFPGGRFGVAVTAVVVVLIGMVFYVPAALAFPYEGQVGRTKIYSASPIAPEIVAVIDRADRLLARSPLHDPRLERTLVFTDGGWRWTVMAVGVRDKIAFRRPFASVLVFNRADIAGDRPWMTAPTAGVRTLSGTIAHESVHVLTARRLGEWRYARLPTWKKEGYADYVSQEPKFGDGDEARLRKSDPTAPILAYADARRRVAARLARNGGSLDELFSGT